MAELGQTSDPRALVPGDPAALQTTIDALTRFGDAIVTAGYGLKELDDGGWSGQAADAFHDFFDGEPVRWIKCGDAFHAAAAALMTYHAVLEWAQNQAAEAIRLWDEAQRATDQARQDHRHAVEQEQRRAVEAETTPSVIPFVDPGQVQRDAAQDMLKRARVDLRSAGDTANKVVSEARDQAPAKPSLFERIGEAIGDVAEGAWEGVTGLASFVGQVSPVRIVIDPAGYVHDMAGLVKGMAVGVTHPVAFGKAIIDYDTWRTNPARAIGHLVPDIALAAISGGAGLASRGTRGAKAAAHAGKALRVAENLPATSAIAGRNLGRHLAKQAQMSEKGTLMAGAGHKTPIRDVPRLVDTYGGKPEEWGKMTSTEYVGTDGHKFQTHWYEHLPTGKRVEFKTKVIE